jgi:hypothetical protein
MGKFETKLRVQKESECCWKLTDSHIYRSDTVGLIIVDAGFETNFASVPRLPFMYLLFGGVGDEAATLHDWLYRPEHTQATCCSNQVDRKTADKVLRGVIVECLTRDGASAFKAKIVAWAMWSGVRIGGASHWGKT